MRTTWQQIFTRLVLIACGTAVLAISSGMAGGALMGDTGLGVIVAIKYFAPLLYLVIAPCIMFRDLISAFMIIGTTIFISAVFSMALLGSMVGVVPGIFFGTVLGAFIALCAAPRLYGFPEGYCQTCGYDLRLIKSPRCPECGADRTTQEAVDQSS